MPAKALTAYLLHPHVLALKAQHGVPPHYPGGEPLAIALLKAGKGQIGADDGGPAGKEPVVYHVIYGRVGVGREDLRESGRVRAVLELPCT